MLQNEDVITHNIADAMRAEAGVESIDLYGSALGNNLETLLCRDGVHFTLEGYPVLAQAIANYLLGEPALNAPREQRRAPARGLPQTNNLRWQTRQGPAKA